MRPTRHHQQMLPYGAIVTCDSQYSTPAYASLTTDNEHPPPSFPSGSQVS
jgi:hypothetical protein